MGRSEYNNIGREGSGVLQENRLMGLILGNVFNVERYKL